MCSVSHVSCRLPRGIMQIVFSYTEHKNFLYNGTCVHSASGISGVMAKNPFEILLSNFSAVERKLPNGVVISYAWKNSFIHLTVTDTIVGGVSESLNSMVDQGMAAIISTHLPKLLI